MTAAAGVLLLFPVDGRVQVVVEFVCWAQSMKP